MSHLKSVSRLNRLNRLKRLSPPNRVSPLKCVNSLKHVSCLNRLSYLKRVSHLKLVNYLNENIILTVYVNCFFDPTVSRYTQYTCLITDLLPKRTTRAGIHKRFIAHAIAHSCKIQCIYTF